MTRERRSLEHDPEKWVPVFGERSCSSKKLKRDDDSKRSHRALDAMIATAPPHAAGLMFWLTRDQPGDRRAVLVGPRVERAALFL
jgi:hypothetical protein